MNKKLIALFALALPLGILASCGESKDQINGGGGNNPGGNDNTNALSATLTLPTDEHFTATSTLDGRDDLKEGDSGILTFKMAKNWHIRELLQNDVFLINPMESDKYSYEFTLIEGENTFYVDTYEHVNEYSPNGLLEGKENSVEKDGTLADVVDPLPIPGGGFYNPDDSKDPDEGGGLPNPEPDKPDYVNGKTIYFYSQHWWDQKGAETSIILYDGNKAQLNKSAQYGSVMEIVFTAEDESYNIYKWSVDASKVRYVEFVRTQDKSTKYIDSRTGFLAVPNFTTYDAYELSTKDVWHKKDGDPYPTAKLVKYSPDYVPALPISAGIYTIYVDPHDYMKEVLNKPNSEYTLNIYYFDNEQESCPWPGVPLEKVTSGEYIGLYKGKLNTDVSKKFLITLAKGNNNDGDGNQTNDIALDFEQYGRDAVIKIDIDNSVDYKKCNFVVTQLNK